MLDNSLVNSAKFQQFLTIFGLTEQPGVIPSQGYDLGNFTGTTSRSGSLSDSNPIESYNFTVNQTSDFILGLRNLTADVDVSLGRDLNNDGFIEFDEEIDFSEQEGTADESLNLKLNPGNYLVDVYLFEEGKNTAYNLDLSLNPFATPTEALGKSLAGATNVGTLNGIDSLTGNLNTSKSSDIYRFNLDENRDFSIFLEEVSNNSNLQLIQDFNNNQIIDSGEVINTAVASSTNAGVIAYNRQLAGTYFVRVESPNATNYSLSLEAPGSGNTGNEFVPAISANESIEDELLVSDTPNSLIPGAVLYDYQLIDVVGNQQVNISLTSTEFDPALQLINTETGQLIAQNDNSNGTNAALSFTVDPNIDYRILVTSFAGEGKNTGAFTLTTTSSTLSGNLGFGQTQNGALAASDLNDDGIFFDEYQITGITPGQAVNLSVNSTQFDTYLELIDANTGLVVGDNDDINNPTNRNSQIRFIAEPGESLIARVTSFDTNATGNYSLSLTPLAASRTPVAQAANGPGDPAFFANITDEQIRTIAQQRTANGQLNRNGMLAILNQITLDNQVTQTEIGDLKTLVKEKNVYTMPDSVQYLGSQVANKATEDVGQFNQLVAQHFLGTVRPDPIYQDINDDGSPKGNPVSYTYQPVQGKLFGEGGPKIGDIAQKPFGNCYYVAGLGAMFGRQNFTAATSGTDFKGDTTSQIITQMIIANTNDNGQLDNTYTVRFYNENDQAEYITVDNQLIIDADGNIAGSARDTTVNNPNNVLWVPILERAFTQWQGSYNKVMNGGDPGKVQQQVKSGSKSSYYTTPQEGQEIATFEALAAAFDQGKTVTGATPGGKNTIFYGNHAYTVANAYVNGAAEQRVVVYNPHGQDGGGSAGVSGEDQDIRVTPVREDGFVDVSFEEFKKYMEYFFVL